MTEAARDGSPEALDEYVTRAADRVAEARYAVDQAALTEREWVTGARLHMVCPHCGATPGQWCVVASGSTAGRRAHYLHEARGLILRTAAWHARNTARAHTALADANKALTAARSAR